MSNVLPQGWEEKELSFVCDEISYGYTASAQENDTGTKLLRITDIQGGTVNWNSVPFCEIDEKNISKYKLIDGDIVVARTGNSTGENYIFCGEEQSVYASYLIKFKVNSENYSKFVWYQMRSNKWWGFISNIKTGSAQAGANAKALGTFKLNLPKDINKQKKIADILSAFDDKIELNNQMNQTLEDMATTLFKEWFENFNFPNEQGKPYKDNDGEMKSSELGEIPIDWEVKQLVKITSKIGDGLHGTPKYTEEGEYFFINGNNLVNGIIELGQNTKKANIDEYEKYKKVLNKNTILLSINGTLGNIAFYNEEKVFLSKSVCYINGLEDYYKVFIVCLFKSNYFKQYLYNYANGTTIKNLSLKSIRELNFSINKNICKQFSNIVNPIFEHIQQNQQQNQILKEQRDTLLPKLMSGEIRV